MAMNVQKRGARFQLRVKHPLLLKPFFFTFDQEGEAISYGTRLEALLASGIVPAELLASTQKKEVDPLVIEVIRAFSNTGAPAPTDSEVLDVLVREVAGLRVSELTFSWTDEYVKQLKSVKNLSPGTIRKRIGSLARVIDWHIRRTTEKGQHPLPNPLRLLPRGYSTYKPEDLKDGSKVKRDVVRDRRLSQAEYKRVLRALSGVKRGDKEREYPQCPALSMLFALIVDTGMRLFESYRLEVDSIDFKQGIINVQGSKGHRGHIKQRMVPLKPALRAALQDWCADKTGLVFPFWDGTDEDKDKASGRLTARFRTLFEYAQVKDFTEHDLRHHATCLWVEMRRPDGQWVFSEIEVCKIMGWTDTRMMLRYASLRGSDLAARLL